MADFPLLIWHGNLPLEVIGPFATQACKQRLQLPTLKHTKSELHRSASALISSIAAKTASIPRNIRRIQQRQREQREARRTQKQVSRKRRKVEGGQSSFL